MQDSADNHAGLNMELEDWSEGEAADGREEKWFARFPRLMPG